MCARDRAKRTPGAVRRDYERFRAEGVRHALHVFLFCPGFWAALVYRMLHGLQRRCETSPWRQVANQICHCGSELCGLKTRILLPPSCRIGPGLYIPHFGPVTLNPGVRIGENCTLHQGVTIGQAGRGERKGSPTLGDRVYVGANAVIIGKITIGDDVAIGAGAVVTRSVPSRSVVAGNPARIVSERGSFDLICYPDRETDLRRLDALVRERAAGCD